MTHAWFEVSTGKVEALPVLIPAPWPAALHLVLDLLSVVDVNALRTYDAIAVRPAHKVHGMETWSLAQVLLHRTGVDARDVECDWGLGVSLTRETLILFGRGRHEIEEIPQRGDFLVPMVEWYLKHLPDAATALAEAADLAAP